MMNCYKSYWAAAHVCMAALLPLTAQSTTPTSSDVFAKNEVKSTTGKSLVINGQRVDVNVIENNIKTLLSSGQKDSLELRELVINEIINKTLLLEDAYKSKIDQNLEVKVVIEEFTKNTISQAKLNKEINVSNISDADLKTEYDRQIKILSENEPNIEYKLQIYSATNEKDALQFINFWAGSPNSMKLLEKIKQSGLIVRTETIEWILGSKLAPAVGNVVANVPAGKITQKPIQINNEWVVIEVQDTRNFKTPSLEESKNSLIEGIAKQRAAEYIQNLRKSAKIEWQ